MNHSYSTAGCRAFFVLIILCTCLVAGVQANETYVFDRTLGMYDPGSGTFGFGDAQFYLPEGIAVNPVGIVYVMDRGNNRIQKFDTWGMFISSWGSEGTDPGQFNSPFGIAIDLAGNVYVADWGNNRIQRFNKDGYFLHSWDLNEIGNGINIIPQSIVGIAVDTSQVYVTNVHHHKIHVFDRQSGTYLSSFGSYGNGDGQFWEPWGIGVDWRNGIVSVVDSRNHRIQQFNRLGTFIRSWGTRGDGDGQFESPKGIAVDDDGNVYVADAGNYRIQKFDSSGTFITSWGSEGTDPGQFRRLKQIAVDRNGYVYATEGGPPGISLTRIQVFRSVNQSQGVTPLPTTRAPIAYAPFGLVIAIFLSIAFRRRA